MQQSSKANTLSSHLFSSVRSSWLPKLVGQVAFIRL
jgi:hypothetical protein